MAFEAVARGHDAEILLEPQQCLVQRIDEIGLDRVFDDGEAVLFDFRQMGFEAFLVHWVFSP